MNNLSKEAGGTREVRCYEREKQLLLAALEKTQKKKTRKKRLLRAKTIAAAKEVSVDTPIAAVFFTAGRHFQIFSAPKRSTNSFSTWTACFEFTLLYKRLLNALSQMYTCDK